MDDHANDLDKDKKSQHHETRSTQRQRENSYSRSQRNEIKFGRKKLHSNPRGMQMRTSKTSNSNNEPTSTANYPQNTESFGRNSSECHSKSQNFRHNREHAHHRSQQSTRRLASNVPSNRGFSRSSPSPNSTTDANRTLNSLDSKNNEPIPSLFSSIFSSSTLSQDEPSKYDKKDFMKWPDKKVLVLPIRNFSTTQLHAPRKDDSTCSDSDCESILSSKFLDNKAGPSKSVDRGWRNRRDNNREPSPSISRDASKTSYRHHRAYNNRGDERRDRENTSNFSAEDKTGKNEFAYRDGRKKNKRTIVICDGSQKNQNHAEGGAHGKVFYVGFKYLKEQSEKETAQIVAEMMNLDSAMQSFLERRELQADWLFLLVNILSKACSFEFKDARNAIINRVCQSEFLHTVSYYLGDLGLEERQTTIKNMPSFIGDLIEFYSSVINFLPSVAVDKDFPKLIAKTKKAIDSMNSDHGLNVDDSLLSKLNALSSKVEEFKNMLMKPPKPEHKQSRLQYLSNQPPPDDFRNLDLYPTYEDLTRRSFGFVRPNKTKGAYNDEEHYLDVQFRLLREDFIDPLRRGLNHYLEAKANVGKAKLKFKYESLRLYPGCSFLEVTKNDKNQLAFVMNFDPNGKLMRINWENSKRFMYGSLLLFTDDDFTTFFYGTVFNRDAKLLAERKILVTFPNDVQADKNLFSKEFLMAESEVFFEPYFLVMKSLKTLNATNFPMVKYIVHGESATDHPSYKHQNILWNIYDYEVDPFATEYWPRPKDLGLDLHQHRAFLKALTSEFCVIQGPPGTGKTFIGLKIVEVLLQNVTLNERAIRSPLLIVCYTNHALDQFLEGILRYTQKIIRVGGQSKSELLKDFNLRGRNQLSVRNSAAARKQLAPAMIHIMEEKKKNLNQICKMTARKDKLEKPEGILKYHVLRNVMTEDQKNLLSDAKTLLNWLLEYEEDIHSDLKREKRVKGEAKKKDASDAETVNTEAMEVSQELEDEDEDEEDNQLVDEVDVFEMDPATEASLNSDSPYEITINELGTKCTELIERGKWLANLDDDKIEDLAAYQNDLETTEREVQILAYQYEIVEEQLTNPSYNFERMKRILAKDPGHLSLPERWMLYWNWVRILRENVIQELQVVEEKYRATMAQYDDVRQMEDLYVVQQADVVGMTTTCAARLHTLLNELKPAIVVVEEAAEVLETHIVTSLTKSCQHVILIGDHKQLKPSAAVYKLAKDYNIDVSLFERMINNGMDCPMLNVQHRMRPEISSLITPLIYNDLKDDPSVFQFENIRGMLKNLFFLEHNQFEQDVEDTSSRQNNFEADFMIELCYYLILQGYDPEKITMLTTYTGQMFSLRKKKSQRQLMQKVKCIVVDKYQGEENDIILLSLVRSNKEAKIGFLAIENRVCVALSRAKKGFFITGNMDNLAKSSPELWGNIAANLRKQDAIGREIPLYCSRHEIRTLISHPKDFDKVREGGCSNTCGDLLACGHDCRRLCHPLDREHKEIQCHEPCDRRCAREKHGCKRLCFQDCGQCTAKMVWKLPCGHTRTLPCFVDEKTYLCEEIVDDVLPLCKHAVKRKCHQAVEDVACPHPCEDRLECGHACVSSCHKKEDPHHEQYKCKKPCEKPNKMCSRSHQCQKFCFEECGLCTIKVPFSLKCGHEKKLRCSTEIEQIKCFETCGKVCIECRQTCRKKCFENCSPCENKVKKVIRECGHAVIVACHSPPARKDCKEMCNRMLPCGHKCAAKCRNECGTVLCKEMVKLTNVQGLCGHNFVRVPCFELGMANSGEERLRDLLAYCDVPCDTLLKCGDPCAGTCGKCWQGRLHQLCKKNCGSVGICGHSCKYPCRQSCPPCEENCNYRCQHSKCPHKCGVPCKQCKEPCDYKCPHKKCTRKCGELCNREPCTEACPLILKCGHPCIGFCGEPCPPECRKCNEEITDIMFGYEDEEDARFVYLVDCKHTIESKALDIHLNASPEGGEIVMKVCPLCKTPITKTLRYMNFVKRTYTNILKVKRKIFGTEETLKERKAALKKDIQTFIVSNAAHFTVTGLMKMKDMATEYLNKCSGRIKNNQSSISSADLNTVEFFHRALVDISTRLDNLCEYDSQGKKKCLHAGVITENVIKFVKALLFRMHEPAIQINEQLSVDIALELRRYHKMVDFSLVLRNELYLLRKYDVAVNGLVEDLKKLVFGVARFDSTEQTIDKKFAKLQEALKASVPLTSAEKRMINEAMSTSFYGGTTGHWFTCSKGHPYVITECGGAMQKSKCPECGEVIGGEHHQYVATAQLASDFDGAQRPAWSSQNDMRNFALGN